MNDIVYAAKGSFAHANMPQFSDCWRFFYCTDASSAIAAGSMLVLPPEAPVPADAADAAGLYLYMRQIPLVFRQPYLLDDDAHASLLRLMQDVLWHFEAAAADTAPLLSAYGQLLVQHVSLRRPSAPHSQLVGDLAQSIAQNFANPHYELDEQLRSAPYCYDYLCRLFRQEMNTTPHKYLASLRLETAAKLLRQGDGRSVTEISRACGYSDPLYFSRAFKKRYGVSPREYGKSAGK